MNVQPLGPSSPTYASLTTSATTSAPPVPPNKGRDSDGDKDGSNPVASTGKGLLNVIA